MAQQTKSKSTRKSGGGRSKPRGNSSTSKRTTKARANSSGSQSRRGTQSRAGSKSRKRSTSSSSSSNKGTLANAKDASIEAARSTGDVVGSTAKKLKTPAIAAGAGLAGLAGGIALTRSRQRKVLGVPLPGRGTTKSLAGAAKNIGALAEQAGHVAEQARVAGEALGGNEARRSPIEVVLEGLTRRSQAAKSD
jgi:hypothetical protein